MRADTGAGRDQCCRRHLSLDGFQPDFVDRDAPAMTAQAKQQAEAQAFQNRFRNYLIGNAGMPPWIIP
jgi:hypothetical protein